MDNKKKKFSFIDLSDDFSLLDEKETINKNNSNDNSVVFEKNDNNQENNYEKEGISLNKSHDTKSDDLIIENTKKIDNIQETNNNVKISSKKINNLFHKKEKLDVKTNIYLKKWIYDEIEKIYKETGKSRSAIINKLLEMYLNEMSKENE